MAGKGRIRRALSWHLLVIFMALLIATLVAMGFLTRERTRMYMLNTMDAALVSSGLNLASQAVNATVYNELTNGRPDVSSTLNLSNYYLVIELKSASGQGAQQVTQVADSTVRAYGTPADPGTLLTTITSTPTTVAGSGRSPEWRAAVFPIQSNGTTVGSVLIAAPLLPSTTTLAFVTQTVAAVEVIIIIVAALVAWLLIRRSLQPLRSIEQATHAIASGDLSGRVPGETESVTEVGMLAHSINVMLSQIEAAFAAKEESEAHMRRFVSDASHELRTPLATVRGYAELYRMGAVEPDAVGKTFARIESEAQRMTGLVENLLQLARLDENRPLALSTFDVLELAQTALEDFAVRDSQSRTTRLLDLATDTEPDPDAVVMVRADRDRVMQILSNLLTNVLVHTPAGTPVDIAIGYSTDPQTPSSNTSSNIVIDVRDHGPGVSEANVSHIFERFFRADPSRSRQTGGSGLGLSIVAAIMAAHHGTAQALQTPGGGLTIRLVFPSLDRMMQEFPPPETSGQTTR
ncbi:MAG: ATP-binding protein [Actinomycetaceae bacterium]|nr:ATP-binding protein [Actinomycetaceae bacterium]MDY6082711.1 ATP-binding protein [Actinomycetaceae bacterium]